MHAGTTCKKEFLLEGGRGAMREREGFARNCTLDSACVWSSLLLAVVHHEWFASKAFYVSAAGGLHAPAAHALQPVSPPSHTARVLYPLSPPGSRRAFRNVILSGFDSMLFGVNDKWRKSGNSSFIYLWKSQNFLHIPPRDNPEGRLRIIKKFVKVYSLIKVSDISEMVALKTHTR